MYKFSGYGTCRVVTRASLENVFWSLLWYLIAVFVVTLISRKMNLQMFKATPGSAKLCRLPHLIGA